MRVVAAILRAGFYLLYNPLAWTYDLVSWLVSIGQWRPWQRCALPYLSGTRILEVGHGPGHVLAELAAEGRLPVGLDLSAAMGRLAQRRLLRRGRAAPLVRGRVQGLPFADGAFSAVLSTFPTEFILEPATLREFCRVLRPGGRLVCVPLAQITGPGLSDRLAGLLFRLTGQSSDTFTAPLLDRCEAAGLAARLERVRLSRSVVTLLLAEKPM
jgi:ubiquinone/menaquinone biosynthesis C-methylase UbiE